MNIADTHKSNGKITSSRCSICDSKCKGFMCEIQEYEHLSLDGLMIKRIYPKNALLFMEGQPSAGIFLICRGRVKLTTCSPFGKAMIVHIAEAGELVGLASALTGVQHETTAETV